jgi:Rrf2 family transcriptional regulator, iron-sulfur cluster assembly transcription factor
MIFSSTCQHALRALIYLSVQEDRWPVLVREIAEAENIPRPFLSKILHELNKRGLVTSSKGPGGGYSLASSPSTIRLSDIVKAVDGAMDMDATCVLGLDMCRDDAPCALHEFWKGFRVQYAASMDGLTLADAAGMLNRKRTRRA